MSLIEDHVAALPGWQGATLTKIRALVRAADAKMTEEVKWRKPSNPNGVLVWSHDGIVATGEAYKDKVKVTFFRGFSLPDPAGLFNGPDRGATRRAIDLHEGHVLDEKAFKALVKAAVALNQAAS